jgi:uncharacterized protein (TIGR03435 family)
MTRIATIFLLAVFLVSAVSAQTVPAFEVASIRPASGQTGDLSVTLGIRIDGAQIHGRMALKDYIGIAYRLKNYQISGPDWLGSERFDIAATIPYGASSQQIPEMIQGLLAERFQLKTHRDKKDFPVYALVVAKGGLKISESAPDSDLDKPSQQEPIEASGTGSGQGVSVNLGRGASYTFANNRFEGKKLTMAVLASSLDQFLDRPVVDLTNLKGSYDFAFDITEEDYRNMLIRAGVNRGLTLPPEALRLLDTGSPVSFFRAAEKLGLKLDVRKVPLDLLVIDEIRKTPTEN